MAVAVLLYVAQFGQAIISSRLPFPGLYDSSRIGTHQFVEAGHGNLMWIVVMSNPPINTFLVKGYEV